MGAEGGEEIGEERAVGGHCEELTIVGLLEGGLMEGCNSCDVLRLLNGRIENCLICRLSAIVPLVRFGAFKIGAS